MNKTALLVGDPHVTVDELAECGRLFSLIGEAARAHAVDAIVIMGDLYNNHDTMSVRVLDFYCRELAQLPGKKVGLVGNHDRSSLTQSHPHALLAHEHQMLVVDRPMKFPVSGFHCDAMPYFHDNAEFLAAAVNLKAESAHPTLLCHQTFDGGRYENGSFAKEGQDPSQVPYHIISGHLHKPHKFANVNYMGGPRWRTRADANTDRNLLVVEFGPEGYVIKHEIPTHSACRRRWTGEDRPGAPYAARENIGQKRQTMWSPGPKRVPSLKKRRSWA